MASSAAADAAAVIHEDATAAVLDNPPLLLCIVRLLASDADALCACCLVSRAWRVAAGAAAAELFSLRLPAGAAAVAAVLAAGGACDTMPLAAAALRLLPPPAVLHAPRPLDVVTALSDYRLLVEFTSAAGGDARAGAVVPLSHVCALPGCKAVHMLGPLLSPAPLAMACVQLPDGAVVLLPQHVVPVCSAADARLLRCDVYALRISTRAVSPLWRDLTPLEELWVDQNGVRGEPASTLVFGGNARRGAVRHGPCAQPCSLPLPYESADPTDALLLWTMLELSTSAHDSAPYLRVATRVNASMGCVPSHRDVDRNQGSLPLTSLQVMTALAALDWEPLEASPPTVAAAVHDESAGGEPTAGRWLAHAAALRELLGVTSARAHADAQALWTARRAESELARHTRLHGAHHDDQFSLLLQLHDAVDDAPVFAAAALLEAAPLEAAPHLHGGLRFCGAENALPRHAPRRAVVCWPAGAPERAQLGVVASPPGADALPRLHIGIGRAQAWLLRRRADGSVLASRWAHGMELMHTIQAASSEQAPQPAADAHEADAGRPAAAAGSGAGDTERMRTMLRANEMMLCHHGALHQPALALLSVPLARALKWEALGEPMPAAPPEMAASLRQLAVMPMFNLTMDTSPLRCAPDASGGGEEWVVRLLDGITADADGGGSGLRAALPSEPGGEELLVALKHFVLEEVARRMDWVTLLRGTA
jgi:hypothetical protein